MAPSSPSVPPRKRVFKPKTKTGCLTCRRRKIKCDEEKPKCLRCVSSGLSCDGYQILKNQSGAKKINQAPRAILPKDDAPAPLALAQVTRLDRWETVQPQKTSREHGYFLAFCEKFSSELSCYFDSPIWSELVLQASEQDESIRHAIVAVGALDITMETARVESEQVVPSRIDSHHRFAIQQYSKAINQMREASWQQSHSIRSKLLTCLLIICFENLHGNHESAIMQIKVGLRLLEEWFNSRPPIADQTDTNDNIVLYSPAPSIVEDEVIQAFVRLDMQTSSFVDDRPVEYHIIEKDRGTAFIASMPPQFTSVKAARDYWELIGRRVVHFLPTAVRRACTPAHEVESKSGQSQYQRGPYSFHRASSERDTITVHSGCLVQGIPQAAVEGQRKHKAEALRWSAAFEPLLQHCRLHPDSKEFVGVTILRMRFLGTYLMVCCALAIDQMAFDDYNSYFLEIVTLARTIVDHPLANAVFTFDIGFIPQLYIVALKCRVLSTRSDAISMLLSKPWREGVWDSDLAGRMARAVMGIEEEGRQGDVIPESARVKGHMMRFNLQQRAATLTYFVDSPAGETAGQVGQRIIAKEKSIQW